MEQNEITKRFFVAVDSLKDSGRFEGGLKAFCERHNLNRTYLSSARNNPSIGIRPETIAALCNDYKEVSLDYIMLGTGTVFK